jgi:hypothetical protein
LGKELHSPRKIVGNHAAGVVPTYFGSKEILNVLQLLQIFAHGFLAAVKIALRVSHLSELLRVSRQKGRILTRMNNP